MCSIFGLLSDLDCEKWKQEGKPPHDKKTMAEGTYQPYGILSVIQDTDHLKFSLGKNNGDQRIGHLYGTKRNPLKDVGHCWMAFRDDNLILGIAIEDDWVSIDKTYAATLVMPKEPVLERQETVDMSIYGDMIHDQWDRKADKIPLGKGRLGYHKYTIEKPSTKLNDTDFETYVRSDPQGVFSKPTIRHCKRDPFAQISNCFLKVVDENGGPVIKGVMVEQNWVEMYK